MLRKEQTINRLSLALFSLWASIGATDVARADLSLRGWFGFLCFTSTALLTAYFVWVFFYHLIGGLRYYALKDPLR